MVLHMCGLLEALLPDLATIPVRAFEAFTSPPVANTRLAQGREACPDKCLVGGTNAELWTHDAGRIIAEIERDLNALPHHRGIVVSSAGQMPPPCPPETIKAVCDWVKSYPARMEPAPAPA
jgi:uroporphyrinogen-III decarboxylase